MSSPARESEAAAPPPKSVSLGQLVILVLSLWVLVQLFIETAVPLPDDIQRLFDLIDTAICVVFIADFFWRLRKARRKWAFLKWGWIDLVSSIPMLDAFRAGRLVRVVRVLRLLRGIRSIRAIARFAFRDRAQATLVSASVIAASVMLFASIGMLLVENRPDSTIRTAEDALWWAMTTMTTVGYGDKVPVTAEGRFIAVLLMITGVGLFGTFTAAISSWFVEGDAAKGEKIERRHERELRERLDRIEAALDALKNKPT